VSRGRALAGIALFVLLAVGIVLVVTGGDDGGGGDDAAPSTTDQPAARPAPTLAIDDLSVTGVEELSGLAIPDDATDFLTAKLAENQQLDVTFTMAAEDEAEFVTASGLPPLAVDARVITHSSPLWKLNPEGRLEGAADVRDGVNRAVELVPEGDRLRARITLQAV
jgi:hypothetical protein